MERSAEYYQALSAHLPSYLLEWEWAEFKVNSKDLERIAIYFSYEQ